MSATWHARRTLINAPTEAEGHIIVQRMLAMMRAVYPEKV